MIAFLTNYLVSLLISMAIAGVWTVLIVTFYSLKYRTKSESLKFVEDKAKAFVKYRNPKPKAVTRKDLKSWVPLGVVFIFPARNSFDSYNPDLWLYPLVGIAVLFFSGLSLGTIFSVLSKMKQLELSEISLQKSEEL